MSSAPETPIPATDATLSPLFTREAWNPPNLVTMSRLVLATVLFVMIAAGAHGLLLAGLFVLAVVTDAVDGYLARRLKMVTTLGRILDPFADKYIICGTFVFLLVVSEASGVNEWMVIIVISRELFVTSLRGFMEKHGHDFSATWSGKWKMILQSIAITLSLCTLAESLQGDAVLMLRDVLLWAAVAVTVYSGAIYLVRSAQMLQVPPPKPSEPESIPPAEEEAAP